MSSSRSPLLLAIDTSTEQAGLALFDGQLIAEYAWHAGRSHTTTVLPAISWLLGANGLAIADVAAVGVATGPGTFTGLRVGLSVAKGLVIAGDRDLIGVPTLDVVAAPLAGLGHGVLAVIPAGRGRYVWSIYADGDVSPPRNGTLVELLAYIDAHPGFTVAGEPGDALQAARPGMSGGPRREAFMRRPSVLARLAWERWCRGDVDDAASLQATYIHGRPPGSPREADHSRQTPTLATPIPLGDT